ncbi:hypothetical protein HOO54_01255 [Bacillus sp. WMMC1349]|uniref:hypothetical protein n=1 Tax=Bacillus sp. WMMC1349 TaxID=2736254 RepID=UPI001552E662|nr:hypothetical protein [Bacillus sp. WMMC1349]NPC90837.1 hypothetical protein [Bacillus sp. WMMC1349]NPC90893.1 hypothetical protein [Bacillus sp. WMMC1349]NPC90908.1 hypothetical protein [Bacillus sp. WMMC1349]NPC90932.1 hypothetical protein [Bacillus sp. WMMC1349]
MAIKLMKLISVVYWLVTSIDFYRQSTADSFSNHNLTFAHAICCVMGILSLFISTDGYQGLKQITHWIIFNLIGVIAVFIVSHYDIIQIINNFFVF